MKKNIQNSCLPALVLAAGFFATTFPASGVQLPLLNIDESNPSAVVITGTGFNATGTDGSTTANFGVDLVNFFTAPVSIGAQAAAGGSSLQPATGGNVYDRYNSDTYQASGGALLDLNLFSSGASAQTFTSGSQAFNTGTEVIDLSAFLAALPTVINTSGWIYAGNSAGQGNGTPIGRWNVTAAAPVPEPPALAQLALGAMAFAGLAFVRRARRVAASR